jgi:hypothetical protein
MIEVVVILVVVVVAEAIVVKWRKVSYLTLKILR